MTTPTPTDNQNWEQELGTSMLPISGRFASRSAALAVTIPIPAMAWAALFWEMSPAVLHYLGP